MTNTNDSGPGTLRAAITQANQDATNDTITFAPGLTGTIALASALPDLSQTLTIDGPGASALTVARSAALGTPGFRIFNVPSGAQVAISGLTISGGQSGSGGGIFNSGTLTVTNSTISGNTTFIGGGGIDNEGMLTVTNSTLSGNSTSFGGGSGGGIDNAGTLTVTNSTLSGNEVGDGIVSGFRRRHLQRGHAADGHQLHHQRQLGPGPRRRRRRDRQRGASAATVTDSTISGNARPSRVNSATAARAAASPTGAC